MHSWGFWISGLCSRSGRLQTKCHVLRSEAGAGSGAAGEHVQARPWHALVALYRAIRPRFGYGFKSCCPDNPYPPNSGGGVFTPQIWGGDGGSKLL